MLFLRFIALLTIPAFLLCLPGSGGANLSANPANTDAHIEGKRVVRFVTLAPLEQVKSVVGRDFQLGKTPIHWLSFTYPLLKPVWRISAVVFAQGMSHAAPSLTGTVVLRI